TVGQRAEELYKEIRVSSNDPTNPVVALGLRMQVVAAFEGPPWVGFGKLDLGTAAKTNVVVKRLDGRKLAFTKIESSSPLITAKAEPADVSNANVRVDIRAEGSPRK